MSNKISPHGGVLTEHQLKVELKSSDKKSGHHTTTTGKAHPSIKMGTASNAGVKSNSNSTSQHTVTTAQLRERARKISLGKQIFFDKRLSNPPGVSCATCHDPAKGYSNDQIMEGAVAGRYGNRRPPTIVVAKYNPPGPPVYDEGLTSYVGGFFWDGRSATAQEQPGGELSFPDTIEHGYPFFNPNEMNNVDSDGTPDPDLVISKIESSPYASLFRTVYGETIFNEAAASVFPFVADALVAFETSDEVAAFTSKNDAVHAGRAHFTEQELRGAILFNGKALCSQCHNPAPNRSFSQFCYANLGVPKNPDNPYYQNTNPSTNPFGYNKQGANFVDVGLGDFLKPAAGAPPTNGSQKVVTVRNVGLHEGYMANGYFKRLKRVVHFYNTRNRCKNGMILNFNLYDASVLLSNPPGDPLAPVYAAVGGEAQAEWERRRSSRSDHAN